MSKYNNRWKCEEIIAAHVLQSVSRCMNVFGHSVSDRKLVVERIGRVAQSFRREEDGPADFSISRVASKARSAPNFISDAFASKWITGSEGNRRIYRDLRNRVVEPIKLAWPDLEPYLKHAGWFDERNWPQDQVNVMIDLRNLVGSHGREYSWIYLAQHMEAKAAEMGLERRKYSGEAVEDNYLASKEDYDMFSPLDPDRFKPDARRKEIDLNKPQDKWDPVTMGCTPDFYQIPRHLPPQLGQTQAPKPVHIMENGMTQVVRTTPTTKCPKRPTAKVRNLLLKSKIPDTDRSQKHIMM